MSLMRDARLRMTQQQTAEMRGRYNGDGESAGTPLPMVGYSHPRMFLLKCLLIVPARMGDRPG